MTAPKTIDGAVMLTDEQIDEIADDVIGAGTRLSYAKARKFARALLSASKPAAPDGWRKGQWGYQTLFNAIGDAVTTSGTSVSISVQAFEDSMLAAAPAAPAQSGEAVAEVRYSNDLAYAQWLTDAPAPGTKLYTAPQPSLPAKAGEAVVNSDSPTLWEAFEMGFSLRGAMLGHVLDGRDVGRLTTCEFWHPTMLGMHEGTDLHVGLTVSEAIVKLKTEVRRRLDAFDAARVVATESAVVLGDERAHSPVDGVFVPREIALNYLHSTQIPRHRRILEAILGTRAASPQAAKCATCNGHGMIGGPSYREPDEGGEPCPDCATATQRAQTEWKDRCAALVDIYDDALNNSPENRCYVDGAFKAEIDEVRALLTAAQPASGGDQQQVREE